MKRASQSTDEIVSYTPGDVFFEADRVGLIGHELMSGGSPDDKEFDPLREGLLFLKFDGRQVRALYSAIGGIAKTISTAYAIVGAYNTVSDLLKELGVFGTQETPIEETIKGMAIHVEQLYERKVKDEMKKLKLKGSELNRVVDAARRARADVGRSRSRSNLEDLDGTIELLDEAILEMLDPISGEIAFIRRMYEYSPGVGHWIDAAITPFMTRADGAPVAYRDPNQELQSDIWDPGHYIGTLFYALSERVAAATALEPAFRSTGHGRESFIDISEKLRIFTETWRQSILIVHPEPGLNDGHTLMNPTYAQGPADSIPVGAIDPVTGVAAFRFDWRDFEQRTDVTKFGESSISWPSAKDYPAALEAARKLQAQLVDQVIRASGIGRLSKLRDLFERLSHLPTKSDFVNLPDARFRQMSNLIQAPQEEQVDLGRLKMFSPNRNKTYTSQRYHQRVEKTFSFRMARRADYSRVQLGYQLWISGRTLTLCEFSSPGTDEEGLTPFPTGRVSRSLTIDTNVYDCFQSRRTSAVDEDLFESDARIDAGERMFLNERPGTVRVDVTVDFHSEKRKDQYAGEAKVTIRTPESADHLSAFILNVEVLEERSGISGKTDKVNADSMTVHFVPSYLVVGPEFFADFHAAMNHMNKVNKHINERFSLHWIQPGLPDPEPMWQNIRYVREIDRGEKFINSALRTSPDEVAKEIDRFRVPSPGF